jgi:hypothetical protein
MLIVSLEPKAKGLRLHRMKKVSEMMLDDADLLKTAKGEDRATGNSENTVR